MTPPLLPSFSLEGKRALVTGAAQGIGFTLVRALGAAGAELLLNDVDPAKLEIGATALRDLGLRVAARSFDVAHEAEVIEGVAALEAEAGAVDILINNAGIHRRGPLETMNLADWQGVIEVNLTRAFLRARAVAPVMIARQSGKIINICSVNFEVARPSIANYAAAKGRLMMLTRSMAVEWGRHNIRRMGSGRDTVLTEMTRGLVENTECDRWICGRTPAGRLGVSEDVSGAVGFLSSPAANFISGQVLYVEGGLLASLSEIPSRLKLLDMR